MNARLHLVRREIPTPIVLFLGGKDGRQQLIPLRFEALQTSQAARTTSVKSQ